LIDKLFLLIILILPFIGSLISWIIGRKNEEYRDRFNILLTGIELLLVTILYKRVFHDSIQLFIPDVMGTGLYLKLDLLRYIFLWVTSFVWFLTTVYSTQYLIRYKHRNRYYSFFILTLGSTIGIFLSEHLLNLFTFFEVMSFTSYLLVIHDEDEYSHDAGRSYISMAIIGGLVLLMGLFLLYDYTGTLLIEELVTKIKFLDNIKYLIVSLIIIGFGVKASMVPLHVWLPKAHPAAPTPASAILSGILVKTGIFGILIMVYIIMSGDFILSSALVIIGFINMFLGGLLALFQRNIKRILAYSSMSQIGYILVGIGFIGILKDHNAIAIYATLYHIFNHAIFKVLLFLCAGVIYMIIHELSINVIRGFGRHKHLLKLLFLIGLLGIIGMPGFNGFISKTLLHEALAEAHHLYHNNWLTLGEYIFTISSSFTVAYLLKIFYGVFMEDNPRYYGQYREHIKKRAILPMVVLSLAIIFIGIQPGVFLKVLNRTVEDLGVHGHINIHIYTSKNIISSFTTMIYGFLIFFILIFKYLRVEKKGEPIYINPSLKWFNLENDLYIPVGKAIFHISSVIFHVVDRGVITLVAILTNGIKKISGVKVRKPKISKTNIDISRPRVLTEGIKINRPNIEIPSIESPGINDVTFSELFLSVRERFNSLLYAVFIFAVMIITILISLLFKIL